MKMSLTAVLVVLMAGQALLGLRFAEQYRDAEWIRATWHGNDWVTLLVAVPLLAAGHTRAASGRPRAVLLWLGVVGYAAYNYAFYLFGAALNVFFPLYILLVLTAGAILIQALPAVDAAELGAHVRPIVSLRVIGAFFTVVAAGLTVVWLGVWVGYAFFGRATPVEPEAFRLVAALDLTVMVPLLFTGGVLLWRERRGAIVIASMAGVQASLYLLVLTVNAAIAIARGLADAPGELPLWALLFIATGTVTVALFAGGRGARRSH
jgi:hypothetical protein